MVNDEKRCRVLFPFKSSLLFFGKLLKLMGTGMLSTLRVIGPCWIKNIAFMTRGMDVVESRVRTTTEAPAPVHPIRIPDTPAGGIRVKLHVNLTE